MPATIVLVGGGSGTGKTLLAQNLASHLRIPLNLVDDFRLFAQRVTDPAQVPALHYFVDEATAAARGRQSTEQLRDRLLEVARTVSFGLEVVIAHHLSMGSRLVLEGDAIIPKLAAATEFAGVSAAGVKALFLHEPDESHILANMLARGRGIHELTPAEQRRVARVAWLYGESIAAEAAARGLPVVAARPHGSLFVRVLAAIQAA